RQRNVAKPPKLTQPGWFSFALDRKTTPSSRSAEASRHFVDRSATPPCGDARRGMRAILIRSQLDRPPVQSETLVTARRTFSGILIRTRRAFPCSDGGSSDMRREVQGAEWDSSGFHKFCHR